MSDRVIHKYQKMVGVKLSKEERGELGEALAQLHGHLDKLESEEASHRESYLADRKSQESKISELAAVIRKGEVDREVDIAVLADFEQGVALEMRLDTQEVIERRPLEEHERQEKLFGEDKPTDEENKAKAEAIFDRGENDVKVISPRAV